jgi:uncharacterized membrane protein
MTWLQRYRLRHYMRNSIWIIPVVAMTAAVMVVALLHWFEAKMGWQAELDADTMRVVLGGLADAMFTLIVFVCSSLLLVVQLASAQLTPRIIAVLLRNPITKLTLSMFVYTFTFAMAALIRIRSTVPPLTAEIAAFNSLTCLAAFLFLIDRVSRLLRPSGALQAVASEAHQVINSVYPRRLHESPGKLAESVDLSGTTPALTVRSPKNGVVLAFDVKGLVLLSSRHDCVIALVPQVGDFVAPGDPLFQIYGRAELPSDCLYQSIALGAERTMEQDPAFAFRVVVDIASKGLSPAINDPTTAVLAIDQIHHLLRHVGNRCLDDEQVRDAKGRVRLVYRTPDWEDFVTLAVTEIRQYGRESIQVVRRLRAMLENLIQTLPESRAPPLRQQLALLHRSAERLFTEPEERALAEVSDSQGVGSKSVLSGPRALVPVSPSPASPARAATS